MTDYRDAMIERYLKEFDRQATGVPRPQRRRMRGEISAHLQEAIPVEATEALVSATLADFGTVEEILEQSETTTASKPNYRRGLLILISLIAGLIVVTAVLMVLPLLFAGVPTFP